MALPALGGTFPPRWEYCAACYVRTEAGELSYMSARCPSCVVGDHYGDDDADLLALEAKRSGMPSSVSNAIARHFVAHRRRPTLAELARLVGVLEPGELSSDHLAAALFQAQRAYAADPECLWVGGEEEQWEKASA